MQNCQIFTRSGDRTHEDYRPLDLKSNALTSRPSWYAWLKSSGSFVVVSPRKLAGPLGGRCSNQGGKVCTSSWVAYWVRYGLILRMLNSAKRRDLETEAMWSVKVSWSSIMTPRFLAVLDGTRDKESILMPMWW